ncbi:MAG: hypothetical protein KAU38_02435, partial [Desulfobacterales bacterium]|nr:hypothetical protein [Desulfobacterales bacterium]
SSLVVPASNNKVLGDIDFVSPRKIRLLTIRTVKSLTISAITQLNNSDFFDLVNDLVNICKEP